MTRTHRRKHEHGVALVMVLLLLSMTVLIAADVMERLEQDRTRTANLLLMEQSWAYLLSAEALGIRALSQDLAEDRRKNQAIDACSEEGWAVRIGPLPWDNGLFTLSIQDLQGRLNINSLAASKDGERQIDRLQVERLKRLLLLTLGSEEAMTAGTLGEEAGDWTDSNTLVDGLGGAEDTEYQDWRTANTLLGDVSELRALRAAKAELWRPVDDKPLFSRYITALPEGVRVNVNTAPAEVLQSLVATLDGGRIEAIIAARDKQAFTAVDEVLALPELAQLGAGEKQELKNALAVNSEYFQIMSEVTVDGRTARLLSEVYRPRGGGMPQVIRRDLGHAFTAPENPCNPGYEPRTPEASS